MKIWPCTRYLAFSLAGAMMALLLVTGCSTGSSAPKTDRPAASRDFDSNVTAPSSGLTTSADPPSPTTDRNMPDAERSDPDLSTDAAPPPDQPAPVPPSDASGATDGRQGQSITPPARPDDSEPAPRGTATPPCDGWPKPDLVLVITGRQNGYIEPCGCTGFVNAKGGLTRRFTLLEQLRARGWDVVALDVGNQVERVGRQAELKFQTTIDILKKMDYAAVGLGPDDLRLSFGELYAAIADVEGQEGPFVCANATLFDVPRHYRVLQTPVGKVGITSILGNAEQNRAGQTDEIEFRDPAEALRQTVNEMKQQRCNLLILLAHASIDQSQQLARQFPDFGLVVTAGGAGEPPLQPEPIDGSDAPLVQVGTKGMHVGVIGLYRDPEKPPRYERVLLDDRFPDSREVLDTFANYETTLKELGLEGLGLRPVRHPSGRTFVGSEACGECHETAYEIYKNTPHFEATVNLAKPTERSDIPRIHDPECISCHVTGWNPQGYFPYETGYLDYEKSAAMHSVGCESCHGPGSAHVAAEQGESDADGDEKKQMRQQMRLTIAEAKRAKCYQCHDLDNSPGFQKEGAFEHYWQQVKHEGMY